MTYPPTVAALVKAADDLLAGVTTHRGVMTFEFGAVVNLKHALAALTVEPTPERIEELAEWICNTEAEQAHARGNLVDAQYDWGFMRDRGGEKYRDLARALLTASAGG